MPNERIFGLPCLHTCRHRTSAHVVAPAPKTHQEQIHEKKEEEGKKQLPGGHHSRLITYHTVTARSNTARRAAYGARH